ncbi:hypothetical protein BJV74DRAFT_867423 [Russula compacta]|nr:hypothetical protein BJV74DRAFT_867423 [Russula compacta]
MSARRSSEATSNPPSHTNLDSQVKVPWLDTYVLGEGVDALDGDVKLSPFEGIRSLQVGEAQSLQSRESSLKIVNGQHEISKKCRFHAQGTINTHSPLILEASSSREIRRSDSETSFMIEHYISGEYPFEMLTTNELRLTNSARKLLEQSPRKFRDQYGDYFIAGYQRQFMFSALIGCHTSKGQYTKRTEENAKLAWKNVVEAGVSHARSTTISEFQFNGTARVSQSGCDFQVMGPGPSRDGVTIDDVIKMANGLQNKPPSGMRVIAVLRHYSHLYISLPKSVDIAPTKFREVQKLEIMASELERLRFHPACNQDRTERIERELKTFNEGRPLFINNDGSFRESQNALLTIKNDLDGCLQRYNFIQQVKSLDSPAVGSEVTSSNPNPKWDYGIIAPTPNGVKKGPTPVTLDNGVSANEVVLEKTLRFSSAQLKFICNDDDNASSRRRGEEGSSRLTVWRTQAYIVGWTISCQAGIRQTEIGSGRTFTVKAGGLGHSFLWIEVKPGFLSIDAGWWRFDSRARCLRVPIMLCFLSSRPSLRTSRLLCPVVVLPFY